MIMVRDAVSGFDVRSIITGCVGKCLRTVPWASYRVANALTRQCLHAGQHKQVGDET